MRAFVSGATGFIGGAVVRQLLAGGHEVRVLVRPSAQTGRIEGLPVERFPGDLSDEANLRRGVMGCQWVFHVAALFSYWGHPWADFVASNIEGTRRMLEAASAAQAERIVYTSSVVVLGQRRDGGILDEDAHSDLAGMAGFYARSKFLAEETARRLAAQGAPIVIVNPTAPAGAGDLRPTAMGQMILDAAGGRLPGYVDTMLNVIDVDDVGRGHVLAAQRGRTGERYILGGEDLRLEQVLTILAELTGRPRPRLRVPVWAALMWAYLDIARARAAGNVPQATPEKVQLARARQRVSTSKAQQELGLQAGPARQALAKAVAWYRGHGYLPGGRQPGAALAGNV